MFLSESYKNRIIALATKNPSELNEQLVSEGRYDKVTGEIVDLIWGFVKHSLKDYNATGEEVSHYKHTIKIESADILLNTFIKREKDIGYDLAVDANYGDSEIDIMIHLNPDSEPFSYKKLNAKLQDAIRHEIEHSLQDPESSSFKEKKPLPTTLAYRAQVQRNPNNIHRYFTLKDEVPAMVFGMYRQAKTEKRFLDDVFKEYLGYYLEVNEITKKQYDKILNTWMAYAKKNLPKAKYSSN